MTNVNILLGIILILPVYFLQLLIHELSHTIIPKLKGCKVEISLLPRRIEGGYIRFGQTSYGNCPTQLTIKERLWTTLLPRCVNILQLSALLLLVAVFNWSKTVFTILLTFELAAFIDFSYNTIKLIWTSNKRTDCWRVVYYYELLHGRDIRQVPPRMVVHYALAILATCIAAVSLLPSILKVFG